MAGTRGAIISVRRELRAASTPDSTGNDPRPAPARNPRPSRALRRTARPAQLAAAAESRQQPERRARARLPRRRRSGSAKHDHSAQRAGDARRSRGRRFSRLLRSVRTHGSAPAVMAVGAPGRSRFSRHRQHGGAARHAVGARQRRLGADRVTDEAAGGLLARPRSRSRPVFRLDWRARHARQRASLRAWRAHPGIRVQLCTASAERSRGRRRRGHRRAHDDRGAHSRRGEVRRRQPEP